jgi:hypothetical protein
MLATTLIGLVVLVADARTMATITGIDPAFVVAFGIKLVAFAIAPSLALLGEFGCVVVLVVSVFLMVVDLPWG